MPSPNSLQLCSRLSAGHVQHSSPPEWETYDLMLEKPRKDYKELELGGASYCLRKAVRIKRPSELTTYDLRLSTGSPYQKSQPTYHAHIPRPLSLCLYYYLQYLLSLILLSLSL
jgi:hypothetical protein